MPTLKQEGPSSPKEKMDSVLRHMNEKSRSSARQPCDQLFHTPSSSAETGCRVFLMGSLSRRSNGQFLAQIALCDPAKRPLRARAKNLTRQKRTIPSPELVCCTWRGPSYGSSTCPCEAHFRCNEYARYSGAFFITSRRFGGHKAVHPRRPGKAIHMASKKKPGHTTPLRPISEPNVGPHGQKWLLCPTPS